MAKHLKRRKRGWYFQLDIPQHLRPHFGGKARIEQTLSTRDETLAEARAQKLAGEYKLKFYALEGRPSAQEEVAQRVYQQSAESVLSGEIAAYVDRPEVDPVEFGAELQIEKVIEKPGRKYDSDGDPILTEEEQAEVSGILDALRQRRGKAPQHRNRYEPAFEVVANEWLSSWESSRDRRPSNTAAQYRSAIRVFGDYWGKRSIREVTERDVAQFVELLKKLPPTYGRGKLAKLSLQQAIESTSGDLRGLAPATIKRHMIVLNQIWRWAKQHGRCGGDNPFQINLPKVKKKAYLAWELQDLQKLYNNRPKRDDIAEVFTAALYSGLRLGELAELKWGRVREEEGVSYFLVDDPKTEAGRRKVPIHSKLAWLLEKPRGAGGDLVWPTFRPEGARRSGTGDASKLFGAWKRSAGFMSRRFTFHSSRKNFVSQLEQRGVHQSEVARLVGHELGLTFGVYSPGGLNLKRLQEIVELVDYPAYVSVT